MQKSYYAIIPANVRYDKKLKANAKLLYGEITALCNERGYCWASNSYFSELYKVKKETVSRWISQLAELGYIKIELIYKEGTNQIINRYIRINQDPIDEKVIDPIDEKVKDNNTSNNNTINITFNKKQYLEYVFLTDNEYNRLTNEYGKDLIDSKIEDLDNYIGSTGKKYKNHNLTLRNWIKKDKEQNRRKKTNQQKLDEIIEELENE